MQKAVVLYQPLPKIIRDFKKNRVLEHLIKSIPKVQNEKKPES